MRIVLMIVGWGVALAGSLGAQEDGAYRGQLRSWHAPGRENAITRPQELDGPRAPLLPPDHRPGDRPHRTGAMIGFGVGLVTGLLIVGRCDETDLPGLCRVFHLGILPLGGAVVGFGTEVVIHLITTHDGGLKPHEPLPEPPREPRRPPRASLGIGIKQRLPR